MPHRYHGLLLPPPCRQPMILGCQVALFATGCRRRGLDQRLPQPRTPVPGLTALALASAFVVPWTPPRPTGQMTGAGKPAHVRADLRQQILRYPAVDPRDRIQARQL